MSGVPTLSHEETRRLLLWLEKRRLEIPSEGGSASSLPLPMAAGAAAALMVGRQRGGTSVRGLLKLGVVGGEGGIRNLKSQRAV
jgi:hypothetical protein